MQLVFKHKKLSLNSPAIMGILNITPDSFYDGGKYTNEDKVLSHTEKMIAEGADIIDIGACSTRPNAPEIPEDEECKRLIPAIRLIRKKFPDVIISADTFRSRVAEEAVQEGTDMVNDISGGTNDVKMFGLIGKLNVPYVLTHIQGTPQTMQVNPYYKDVVKEVKDYFSKKIKSLKNSGVSQLIIDVGFGFGKKTEHNYSLLNNLSIFSEFGLPVLAGVSRKSMINKILGTTPATALNGTTAANTIALINGANILRVHDVKEAKEAVKIFTFAKAQQSAQTVNK